MTDPDDIRSRVHNAASSIEAGDLDAARSDVHALARRHRTRTRLAAVLGVTAMLAVGAVVAASLAGTGDPDTLKSADQTGSTSVTATTADTADAASTSPARAVQVIDVAGVTTAGADGPPDWVVPWRDGFLAVTTSYPPQALPEKLPDDIVALFPQEVIDLFAGQLPATIAEATTMLSDAGLLDEVSAVIREHPEASAAIYGAPSTELPTVEAHFTTDGSMWVPIELNLPVGANSVAGVATNGDRLAIAYNTEDTTRRVGFVDRFTVASTTDLSTWTTQEVVPPPPPVALPPGIKPSVSAQGLVATDSGWAVRVYQSSNPDPLELLRNAGLDVTGLDASSGYGVTFDDTGLEIQFEAEGSSPQTVRYSWEELGVSADAAAYLQGDSGELSQPQIWASTWDGIAARSTFADYAGELVATPAGFLQWTDQTWFSADGIAWTSSPLPDPDGRVTAAFAYDGGVIALSAGRNGSTSIYRLDERGANAELLDVPGLPAVGQGGFGSQSPPGSAVVVDAGAAAAPPAPVVVELDGYRLTSTNGMFELTEIATGAVLASEDLLRTPPGADSSFVFGIDGITVHDPSTGEALVTFPNDLLNQAEQDHLGDSSGEGYAPDLWLLASNDGERFLVSDLDDSDSLGGPISVSTNGDVVLVHIGDTWTTYRLS